MFDIEFYMKIFELKYQLMNGDAFEKQDVFEQIEGFRSKIPVIYNIETTNACNMRCVMCPRTTMMTRKIETMSQELFLKIAGQLNPLSDASWSKWEDFVEQKYQILRNGMSENHFFLHIIPKVIVLHGYGDPLLDKQMPGRVAALTDRNIPSYFSCNPANIDIEKTVEMFENGLGYIKYSIESVDDMRHKQIRGKASNYSQSYQNIVRLVELKEKYNYKTTIVITMLDLNKEMQQDEFHKLTEAFAGMNVYVYLKSQDQQWYENKNDGTNSIHWQEFCQFPWSSMTIKSNGEAAMCVEDFDNEIILGDANTESIYDIWNNEKYHRLRKDHFDLSPRIKCTQKCDMNLLGNMNLHKQA